MDFNGNTLQQWPGLHKSRVNSIAIDATASTVASASQDGTVSLVQVNDSSGSEPTYFMYHRPVLAVKLHPQFASHKDRPFVCGTCGLTHAGTLPLLCAPHTTHT